MGYLGRKINQEYLINIWFVHEFARSMAAMTITDQRRHSSLSGLVRGRKCLVSHFKPVAFEVHPFRLVANSELARSPGSCRMSYGNQVDWRFWVAALKMMAGGMSWLIAEIASMINTPSRFSAILTCVPPLTSLAASELWYSQKLS